MRITVLGLGYIGLPVAIKLAESGYDVIGYEINKKRLESIKKREFNYQENELYSRYDSVKDKLLLTETLLASDVYIITVQTPLDENNRSDLSYVKKALEDVSSLIKKNDLIILESTVPPYSNYEFIDFLSKSSSLNSEDFDYAYCPETIVPGNVFKELETNSRVIGANCKSAHIRARNIYSSITKGNIDETTFLFAEHVKIFQNAYRDYEIAFANALSVYCDNHNLDVFELINLINKHPRANVLTPGVGVGGHCLPIDPLFILETSDFEPIKLARKINNEKSDYVADKILSTNLDSVIIFGTTYKPDSDDIRHSPSILIAKKLKAKGLNVFFCEPNINDDIIEGFANLSFKDSIEKNILIVLAQKHQYFIDNKRFFLNKKMIDFVGII